MNYNNKETGYTFKNKKEILMDLFNDDLHTKLMNELIEYKGALISINNDPSVDDLMYSVEMCIIYLKYNRIDKFRYEIGEYL